jgi:hypothetical protein
MSKASTVHKLSEKEKLFCSHYAATGSAREAAARAGYVLLPEKQGLRLLENAKIHREIERLQKRRTQQDYKGRALCGYERLAFGGVADDVKLLLTAVPELGDVENMDLFCVSEIKRVKGGGMEIKFFDRLKALELLETLGSTDDSEQSPLYRALEQGVRSLDWKTVQNEKGDEHGI